MRFPNGCPADIDARFPVRPDAVLPQGEALPRRMKRSDFDVGDR